MPLSPLHSAEWLQFTSNPPQLPHAYKWGGKLYTRSSTLTFAAAGLGTAKMFRLPPGRVRVFSYLSRVVCAAGTTNCDLSIGYASYVDEAGVTVAADPGAWGLDLDAGTAIGAALTLPAAGILDLNSRGGIDVEARFTTANSPATGACTLVLAYQIGG